ncbi:hypothetical protein Ga0100231_008210 [Opitutaceae bacterium TAV4]|uniref:hypothetical protein n=1 Tax=Geminisphaera colitermitum TaxID=1148786 RepID=UPI000158D27B|nr:hypothetical protein [Geminisphaera colitermitum]RRJ94344.1 hypothetical protein Ga0100231_008210 [Opitutaceae bacterium TAV4]RRJ98434.1 hypothetical protein Ga0100230_008505 [Opitutaceae bacterium TAV3]
MRITTSTLLAILIAPALALATPAASAQDTNTKPQNLLRNGNLASGSGEQTPGWNFSKWTLKPDSPLVERGIAEDTDGTRFLRLALPAAGNAHVWFQQEIAAEGGSTYLLTFKYRGTRQKPEDGPDGWASLPCGIYFYDVSNKWLGFERVQDLKFTKDWTPHTVKVTAPDNATRIGVRLAIETTIACEVNFTDVVLILKGE